MNFPAINIDNIKTKFDFQRLFILVALIAWGLFWLAPWQTLLENHLWAKVGISLFFFILPGSGLYRLVMRKETISSHDLTFGFVYSSLVIAILGTIGRFIQVSFYVVEWSFGIFGTLILLVELLSKHTNHKTPTKFNTNQKAKETITNILKIYLPLAIVMGLAALMTVQRVITDDDLSYLAHITNWQSQPSLNFNDIYFGVNQLDSPRFWLVSAPFSQALLSKLGQIPALLLLGGYYEPFLAILSVLALYQLARSLHLSHKAALISVSLQVTFLSLQMEYLHAGAPFFHQLSTDKATAAFIFAPIFFQSVFPLFNGIKKQDLINSLLCGFSLSIMHPIIIAFAILIASAIAIFGITSKNYKQRLALFFIFAIILLPQIFLRFTQVKAQVDTPYPYTSAEVLQTPGTETMISAIQGTPFYGFKLSLLKMKLPYETSLPAEMFYLSWLWIAIPLLCLPLLIKKSTKNILAQYCLAAFILTASAAVPLTGWILGYFISAWMLERTNWLFPFGLQTVFLLKNVGGWINRPIYRQTLIILIWTISSGILIATMLEQQLPNSKRLASATQRYQELTNVGTYLDRTLKGPEVIIGSNELNDFIPAISWKAKVFSYRPGDSTHSYFFSQTERDQRANDQKTFFLKETSSEKRLEIIHRYNIRFILIEDNHYKNINKTIDNNTSQFSDLTFGQYHLVAIK